MMDTDSRGSETGLLIPVEGLVELLGTLSGIELRTGPPL
jgi:hypothetical protein